MHTSIQTQLGLEHDSKSTLEEIIHVLGLLHLHVPSADLALFPASRAGEEKREPSTHALSSLGNLHTTLLH